MASKTLNTTAFKDKLLAPLPGGDVPVKDKRFLRQLRTDMQNVWRRHMTLVTRTNHRRFSLPNPSSKEVLAEYWIAHDRQMMTPAFHQASVNWKIENGKFNGGHPAWDEQIERDKAWVAMLADAGIR